MNSASKVTPVCPKQGAIPYRTLPAIPDKHANKQINKQIPLITFSIISFHGNKSRVIKGQRSLCVAQVEDIANYIWSSPKTTGRGRERREGERERREEEREKRKRIKRGKEGKIGRYSN